MYIILYNNSLTGIPIQYHVHFYRNSMFSLKTVLECGSFKMKLSILKLFQLSLPYVTPSSVPPGIGIIPILLQIISEPYLINNNNNKDVQIGEVYNLKVLSSEVIILLRLLLESDKWSELIIASFKSEFQDILDYSIEELLLSDKYKDIIGILSISCYNINTLRVGGKVQFINDENTIGTVVHYQPYSSSIQILFSNQVSSSVYFANCNKIKSISTIECPLIDITEIYDFIANNLILLKGISKNDELEIKSNILLDKCMEFLYIQTKYSKIIPEILSRNIHKIILNTASEPSQLDSFLSTDVIYERYSSLLSTLYYQYCPNGDNLYKPLQKENEIVKSNDNNSDVKLTDAEKHKRELADNLSNALGFDYVICLRALERNEGDPDRAGGWLLEGGRDVEILIAQEQEHSTLEDRLQCSQMNNEEDVIESTDNTEIAINELMKVVPQIKKPVAKVLLEINNGDVNAAAGTVYEDCDEYNLLYYLENIGKIW